MLSFEQLGPESRVRLPGDWDEIVTPEGSFALGSPEGDKNLPSIFATFEKARTCAKTNFLLGEIQ